MGKKVLRWKNPGQEGLLPCTACASAAGDGSSESTVLPQSDMAVVAIEVVKYQMIT